MEAEEREERGSGRSRNVVHTLPRSMSSVPGFLTGPLERVDPAAGSTQLLVLTADPESAVALAEAVLGMTGPAGIELLPVTSARRARRLIADRPVLAVAGSPRDIRDLVRGSNLKLETVETVVLAWADEILAGDTEDIEALEAVMAELPKDAARIVVTSRSEGRVNAFAERYLRRAHREPESESPAEPAVGVRYVTVSRTSRTSALRRLLDDLDPPSAAIVVSSDSAEEAARSTLRLLGYHEGDPAVTVTRGDIPSSTYAAVFYELPLGREHIAAASAAGAVAVVALVEPRELPALRKMAGGETVPFTLTAPGNAARERETRTRRELADVIESGLTSREILALEPLLEKHDGIEVAAAALKLLERERVLRRSLEEARRDKPVEARPQPKDAFRRDPRDGGRPGDRGGRDGGRRGERGGERGSRDMGRSGERGGRHRDDFRRPPRRDRP